MKFMITALYAFLIFSISDNIPNPFVYDLFLFFGVAGSVVLVSLLEKTHD